MRPRPMLVELEINYYCTQGQAMGRIKSLRTMTLGEREMASEPEDKHVQAAHTCSDRKGRARSGQRPERL
jgi:hypothetical protein